MRPLLFLGIYFFTLSSYAQSEYQCSEIPELKKTLRKLQAECGGNGSGSPTDNLKECYDWAYGSRGLNMSRDNAQDLCREIRRINLQEFKDCYSWAYESRGLNLSKEKAINYCKSSRHPGKLKVCYEFVYSSRGLNLSKAKAMEICQEVRNPDEFKTCYEYAYSSRGLNMGKNEAIEYCK